MSTSNTAALQAPRTDPMPAFFLRIFHAYEWIARRELLACAVVLLFTLGFRAALLPWFPEPVPSIHDEFGYLLAGDTFASGRVTNPPHPMWRHFQTFHELMQPTYSSKYPVMQGLTLAFGEKFFGDPWIGVFLSTGLLCAALCWMLQGWMTPNLALLGGLLAAIHIGIFDYWMNSYWGGSLAAIGGALGLGALVRIWRKQQAVHWVTFAVGLSILMHSRPWEGAVLGAEMVGLLAWAWRKFPADYRAKCRRALLPAGAVLAAAIGFQLYLDFRITGHALTLPPTEYNHQHRIAPVFVFMNMRPPTPDEYYLRDGPEWETGLWQRARQDPLGSTLEKFGDIYNFFFGLWPLLVPALVWPYRLRTPEEKAIVILLVLFLLIAIAPVTITFAHYAAPAAALLYARFLQTMGRLNGWRAAGRPLGPAVNVFLVTLLLHQFATNLGAAVKGGAGGTEFSLARAAMVRELAAMPGKQLVIVHYAADQSPFEEWVWNRADIDGSHTVWARELTPQQDSRLLAYFADRRVWLMDASRHPFKLVPYPGPGR
jgi:hypothetical protein